MLVALNPGSFIELMNITIVLACCMRGWILDVSIMAISYKMVSVDWSDCMGGEGESQLSQSIMKSDQSTITINTP